MADKRGIIRRSMGFPAVLYKEVEDYAKSMNITVSGAVNVLLSQALLYQKSLNAMMDTMPLINKLDNIADKGLKITTVKEIDEETKKQIVEAAK